MKKWFGVVFLFFVMFVLFTPVDELVFTLQRDLKEKGVLFVPKKIDDLPVNRIAMSNVKIFWEGVPSANVRRITFLILLFYNRVECEELFIDFDDIVLKNVSITHSILMPHIFFLHARGTIGDIDGEVDLLRRRITLVSKKLENENVKMLMKKAEDGYIYEKSF